MAFKAPRKDITLPVSQEKLTIRKLGPADFNEAGGIPDVLEKLRDMRIRGQEITEKEVKQLDPKSQAFTEGLAVAAIFAQGEGPKLVYKKPQDCADDEFSFWDLAALDQVALIKEVFAFMSEDVAAATAFPAAQE